ncbi:SDR family oxidoreductase [Nonomuraea sp. 3N208]|uniref:SDR family oxidoreductase n=1 Tax=Nonomuraea sp. 3N208 TaxID=3457421 RepID=UPI003FD08C2F
MTVLVTGARGNIGRHVVNELLARHIPGVRALTRRPRRAGEELRAEPARPIEAARASSSPYPTGLPRSARQARDTLQVAWPPELVEVVEGDLTRPQTVAPALDGVELVFLFPVPETVAEIVDLAAAAGVRRIVALSCGSAGHGDEHHLAVERAVAASRLEWTCLRPYGLMSNAPLWAPDVPRRPAGCGRSPWPGRRPWRLRAAALGSHRDALGVHAEGQHHGGGARQQDLRGVEGIDVGRGLGRARPPAVTPKRRSVPGSPRSAAGPQPPAAPTPPATNLPSPPPYTPAPTVEGGTPIKQSQP